MLQATVLSHYCLCALTSGHNNSNNNNNNNNNKNNNNNNNNNPGIPCALYPYLYLYTALLLQSHPYVCPPGGMLTTAGVHKRQSAQSAKRNLALSQRVRHEDASGPATSKCRGGGAAARR